MEQLKLKAVELARANVDHIVEACATLGEGEWYIWYPSPYGDFGIASHWVTMDGPNDRPLDEYMVFHPGYNQGQVQTEIDRFELTFTDEVERDEAQRIIEKEIDIQREHLAAQNAQPNDIPEVW